MDSKRHAVPGGGIQRPPPLPTRGYPGGSFLTNAGESDPEDPRLWTPLVHGGKLLIRFLRTTVPNLCHQRSAPGTELRRAGCARRAHICFLFPANRPVEKQNRCAARSESPADKNIQTRRGITDHAP